MEATYEAETAIAKRLQGSIAPPPPTQQLLPLPTDNREYIKVMLVGSPDAVTNAIQVLYRRGYARVWEWSPPQPTQKTGDISRNRGMGRDREQ